MLETLPYSQSPPSFRAFTGIELHHPRSYAQFDLPSRGCYDRTAGWSSLVARWAHNPKVGGSNPPPATNLKFLPLNHLKLSAGSLQYHNRLPLQAINPRKAVMPCSDIILEKKVRQGMKKDRRSRVI